MSASEVAKVPQQETEEVSKAPKWTPADPHPKKEAARPPPSSSEHLHHEAVVDKVEGQTLTASSDSCYNHYARNLLLVHK